MFLRAQTTSPLGLSTRGTRKEISRPDSAGHQVKQTHRLEAEPSMAEAPVPKTCKVVLAETIAKDILSEVTQALHSGAGGSGGPGLCLVAFLANDDPAAIKYAEWSKKTCEEK